MEQEQTEKRKRRTMDEQLRDKLNSLKNRKAVYEKQIADDEAEIKKIEAYLGAS